MRDNFFPPNFIARTVKLLQRIDGHRYSFSNTFEVNATEHFKIFEEKYAFTIKAKN